MNFHNFIHFNDYAKQTLQKFSFFMIILCMAIPSMHYGQEELPREYKKYNLDLSSTNSFQSKSSVRVMKETISEKGATWLRLFFEDVNLGKNSTLTITSTLDGASQTLTSETIQNWKNGSAYFNGDQVTITITAAPKEKSIGLKINKIGIGKPFQGFKTQCGANDDRVSSFDRAIGRIVPIGCTGWITSNGNLVTAGHCGGDGAQIIEFNVPRSNANTSIVHPHPRDQYPINTFITEYDGSEKTDWAVFSAADNPETGKTPIQAQRKSFRVVQSAPGRRIRITGYGIDTGSDNQTQQTHTGPLYRFDNTFVRYKTDTRRANSGSPIIDANTGNAVGVHAYGDCERDGSGANFGVRTTVSAFWNALQIPAGPIFRMIKRNATGFAMDGGNGEYNGKNIHIWTNKSTNRNQHWIEINHGNGYFSYVKRGTRYAIDGSNGSSNGQNVKLWEYNKNVHNQHWKKTSVGNGFFRLEKRNSPGYSIDNGNGAKKGQNVKLWQNVNFPENQHWLFVEVKTNRRENNFITNDLIESREQDSSENLKVSIFPNPATDSFSIQLEEGIKEASAKIFSIEGKEIKMIKLKEGIERLETASLSLNPGMYLIEINSNAGTTTQKLIIK